MKNACKSKYEYVNVHEQGDFVLPVLEVRGHVFYCESVLVISASLWNGSFALKHPAIQFTILKFLVKNAKFVFDSERNFQVFLIRFRFVFI